MFCQQKYKLDRICYDYNQCKILDSTTIERYSIIYDNFESDGEMSGVIYPYKKEKRTLVMQFNGIVPDLNRIMGTDLPNI